MPGSINISIRPLWADTMERLLDFCNRSYSIKRISTYHIVKEAVAFAVRLGFAKLSEQEPTDWLLLNDIFIGDIWIREEGRDTRHLQLERADGKNRFENLPLDSNRSIDKEM